MALKQLMQAMVMVNLSLEGQTLSYKIYSTHAHKVINIDTVSSLLVTLKDGQSLEIEHTEPSDSYQGLVSTRTELRFKLTDVEASLLSEQAVSEVTLRHKHGVDHQTM